MVAKKTWQGKVMTVEGLIPAGEMGVTLPHEHLVVQGWDYKERNYFNSAYMELVQYPLAGGKTLVDLSSVGRDRDPVFFKKLAAKSGFTLIIGTGFYKDAWLPPEVHKMDVYKMTQFMVDEITEGVDGTGIQAGVIGEVGVSRPITTTEERSLAASARAQRETGAAIIVHFEIGTPEPEYEYAIGILKAAGADLSRVAVSHLVPRPDNFETYKRLAGRGCFLAFDLFGQESWPLMKDLVRTHPEVQYSSVKGFVDNGLLGKILISQNVCHIRHMTVNSGSGYVHILTDVTPRFKVYGVSDTEIQTMMVENPKRLLAFQS